MSEGPPPRSTDSVRPGAAAFGQFPVDTRLPQFVQSLVSIPAGDPTHDDIAEWLLHHVAPPVIPPRTLYARFRHEILAVLSAALPSFIRMYVPPNLAAKHGLLPAAYTAKHVDETLVDPKRVIAGLRAGHAAERKTFEAARNLALALLFLSLTREAEFFDVRVREEWNIERRTARDRANLLPHLKRIGAIHPKSSRVVPLVFRSARPPYRCIHVGLRGNSEEWLPKRIRTRMPPIVLPPHDLVHVAAGSDQIPAVARVRRKGLLSCVGKMLTSNQLDPRHVPDRRGIRFAFRTRDDLEKAKTFLFVHCQGIGRKEHLNPRDAAINPYAAPQLLLASDHLCYGGARFEVQCMLVRQAMDILCSTAPEQARLYHRRQYTGEKGLLGALFPPDLYGVDWSDPHIQTHMDRHIKTSLRPR